MNNKSSCLPHFLLACVIFAGIEISAAASPIRLHWENRSKPLMNGSTWISPTASGTSTAPLKVDGNTASGWTVDAPMWNTDSVADGWHTLTLAATTPVNADVLILNDESLAIHEGELQTDEFWQAGVTHIVRHWVRIPEGKRLVIGSGAVVKFCENTGIINNGTLSALSATLTALEDDTKGGDANLDGNNSTPSANSYAIENNGTLTAIGCELSYATEDSEFSTTIIAEGAFSGCEEITKVTIPAEVTEIGANAFSGCANLKEITFEGTTTKVDDTAFDGCDNLQKVYFPNGLPETNYVFGNANPTIYANVDPVPPSWSGYTVYGYQHHDIPGDYIPYPEEEGEPGQVLTLTEDGVEWQYLPIDNSLDTESENAVQNKVFAEAIDALEATDTDMKTDIADLQSTATTLSGSISTLDGKVTALQKADTAMQSDITTLKANSASLADADNAIKGDVANLKKDVDALKSMNQELTTANQQLTTRLNALLAMLENSGKESQVLTKNSDGSYSWQDAKAAEPTSEVLIITLAEGWNLVAMPGNIVMDESEAAILSDVDIYTYDKTQQIYMPSEGLKPLNSYWMHAPKACTIHFKEAAPKGK